MAVHKGFTFRYGGRASVLKTPIGVSLPFLEEDLQNENKPLIYQYTGIWDTGATGSVITKRVANALGLQAINVIDVNTASGVYQANVYLVNLVLPDNVIITGINVTEGNLPDGDDVLIGMNIISMGDFAVTNLGGKTMMSFRIPSVNEIDFVPDIQTYNSLHNGNHAARRAVKSGAFQKSAPRKGFRP
jgi:predicted aspartyl protease